MLRYVARTGVIFSFGSVGLLLIAMILILQRKPAHALPSFAAQTGQPCTACHIGGFGPQLTPLGRAFKIDASTDIATRVRRGVRLRILYVETPDGPVARKIMPGPTEEKP